MEMQNLLSLLSRLSKESYLSADDKELLGRLISTLEAAPAIDLEGLHQCVMKFKPKTKAKKTKLAPTLNVASTEVDRLEQELENQWANAAATQSLIDKIRTDKSIRTQDLSALASKIRGSSIKFKSKGEGLKQIETWYARRRETHRRLSRTDDIY